MTCSEAYFGLDKKFCMFVWPCARLQTVFRSGMKALESLEFLHMDAFFVPFQGTLSCDAGKNKEIHAYVAHQRMDLAKMNLLGIARQVKKLYVFLFTNYIPCS